MKMHCCRDAELYHPPHITVEGSCQFVRRSLSYPKCYAYAPGHDAAAFARYFHACSDECPVGPCTVSVHPLASSSVTKT